jgi:hypothetical protein
LEFFGTVIWQKNWFFGDGAKLEFSFIYFTSFFIRFIGIKLLTFRNNSKIFDGGKTCKKIKSLGNHREEMIQSIHGRRRGGTPTLEKCYLRAEFTYLNVRIKTNINKRSHYFAVRTIEWWNLIPLCMRECNSDKLFLDYLRKQ